MPRTTGRIVGLTGYASAGKDAAAAGLVAEGWTRQAFADPVRSMALAIDPWIFMGAGNLRLSFLVGNFGWDEMKRHTEVRRLLQAIGTDGVRVHLGADAWVQAFELARDRRSNTVAPDVRFPNEADHIRRHGGIVIRIDRPGVGPVNGHASENVDSLQVDATVVNDGTIDQLQDRVAELVELHYSTPVAGLPF
jgi:hypothetical protein